MIGLVADILLGLALAGAIVVGIRLERRLDALRAGRGEMAALIKALNLACERAELGVNQLRAAATEGEAVLARPLAQARALGDELGIMTETADRLAQRLERAAGNLPRTATAPRTGEKTEAARQATPVASAPFLKALQGVR